MHRWLQPGCQTPASHPKCRKVTFAQRAPGQLPNVLSLETNTKEHTPASRGSGLWERFYYLCLQKKAAASSMAGHCSCGPGGLLPPPHPNRRTCANPNYFCPLLFNGVWNSNPTKSQLLLVCPDHLEQCGVKRKHWSFSPRC